MTYEEWIRQTENILKQYNEGAIFAAEAFNAVIARATEVEQKAICWTCGREDCTEHANT